MMGRSDHEFANDVKAALEEQSPRGAWLLILFITISFAGLMIWASQAELEEVTTGSGRVIPSRQIQVVQTLEGGLVRSIAIQEGDLVKEGQDLMQIDDTSFASRLGVASKALGIDGRDRPLGSRRLWKRRYRGQ